MTKLSRKAGDLHRTLRQAALPLAGFLAFTGLSTVQAQVCTKDADCAPNFECHQDLALVDLADQEASDSETVATACAGANCDEGGRTGEDQEDEATEETQPGPAAGSQQQASQDKPIGGADSAEDPPPRASEPVADCREGAQCEGSAGGDAEEVPGGSCEPAPFTCKSDADCPEPTRCGGTGTCEYHFQECEDDLACGNGYACLVLGTVGTCSSSPVTGGTSSGGAAMSGGVSVNPVATNLPPAVDEDGDAPSVEPEDDRMSDVDEPEVGGENPVETAPRTRPPEQGDVEEADCELTKVRGCFPEAVECESDADCAGDWTCEEANGGPEGWEGLNRVCVPPGILAMMTGHVEPHEESLPEELRQATNADTSAEGSAAVELDSSGNLDVAKEEGEKRAPAELDGIVRQDPSEVALGTQGGSEGEAPGGCSTSTRRRGGQEAWMALLLAAAALFRRRHGSAGL